MVSAWWSRGGGIVFFLPLFLLFGMGAKVVVVVAMVWRLMFDSPRAGIFGGGK